MADEHGATLAFAAAAKSKPHGCGFDLKFEQGDT
jgi:hypothetical protein